MNQKLTQPGTRKLILDAALQIFSETGLPTVTLGRIAQQIGMSKSGLFAHFRSIEQIHVALVIYSDELFRAQMDASTVDETNSERLLHTITRWFLWGSPKGPFKGAPLLSAWFVGGQGNRIRDALVEMENGWRAHLEELVGKSIAEGSFRRGLDTRLFVEEVSGIYYNYAVCEWLLGRPGAEVAALASVQAVFYRATPVPVQERSRESKIAPKV